MKSTPMQSRSALTGCERKAHSKLHVISTDYVYYALSQLNEDQQRLIDYVYFKGYSMKAFAEIEGVSPVAITYRHKEILKKLKEIF